MIPKFDGHLREIRGDGRITLSMPCEGDRCTKRLWLTVAPDADVDTLLRWLGWKEVEGVSRLRAGIRNGCYEMWMTSTALLCPNCQKCMQDSLESWRFVVASEAHQ